MARNVVLALWMSWSLNFCLVNCQQLCEADVVFVLDSPYGSIGQENFAKAISFTQRVVGTVLEIGQDSSLVGAIRLSYCNNINPVVPLGSSDTKSGVISQLGAISYAAGDPCTGESINLGSNMLQGSARTDAARIMIVLTERESVQGVDPCSAAQSAHTQNISMISVGVGLNTDQSELDCIGIDGSFSVDNFDDLQTILSDLVVCKNSADNLNLRAGDVSPVEYNNIEFAPHLDECTSFKYDAMLNLQCEMGYKFTADSLNAVNLTCAATYYVELILQDGTPENSQSDGLFEGDVKGTSENSQSDVLFEGDVNGTPQNSQNDTLFEGDVNVYQGTPENSQDDALGEGDVKGTPENSQNDTLFEGDVKVTPENSQNDALGEGDVKATTENSQNDTLFEGDVKGTSENSQDGTLFEGDVKGTPENSQDDTLFEGDVKGTPGKSHIDVLSEVDVINVEKDHGPNIGVAGSPSPPSNPSPPSSPSPSQNSSNTTPPSPHSDLPTSVTFSSFQLDFDVIQDGAEGFTGNIFFSVDEECDLETSQNADNDIVLFATCLVELVADEVCPENNDQASMFSGLVPLGLLNLEHGEIGIGIEGGSNSSPPPPSPPSPPPSPPSPSPPSPPTSDADLNCVSAGQISPSVPTPSGEGIATSSLTTFHSTLEDSGSGTTPSPPATPASPSSLTTSNSTTPSPPGIHSSPSAPTPSGEGSVTSSLTTFDSTIQSPPPSPSVPTPAGEGSVTSSLTTSNSTTPSPPGTPSSPSEPTLSGEGSATSSLTTSNSTTPSPPDTLFF